MHNFFLHVIVFLANWQVGDQDGFPTFPMTCSLIAHTHLKRERGIELAKCYILLYTGTGGTVFNTCCVFFCARSVV